MTERSGNRHTTQDYLAIAALAVSALSLVVSFRACARADTTFQQAQRPWVSVKTGRFLQVPGPDAIPSAEVMIHNTGLTPARNASIRISMARGIGMFPNLPEPGEPRRRSQMVLAPNTPDIVSQIAASAPMTGADVSALRAGTQEIYVYGYITYEDLLGGAYRTDFCLMWTTGDELRFCPGRNDAK